MLQGLVLPPRVASVQVIVIPIRNSKSSQEDSEALNAKAESIVQDLQAQGIRVKSDARDIYTPGWKYNHWETKVVFTSHHAGTSLCHVSTHIFALSTVLG